MRNSLIQVNLVIDCWASTMAPNMPMTMATRQMVPDLTIPPPRDKGRGLGPPVESRLWSGFPPTRSPRP